MRNLKTETFFFKNELFSLFSYRALRSSDRMVGCKFGFGTLFTVVVSQTIFVAQNTGKEKKNLRGKANIGLEMCYFIKLLQLMFGIVSPIIIYDAHPYRYSIA